MGDVTLADVVERMDRIEAVLKDLAAAVRETRAAAPAPVAAAPRPSIGPPKVRVAPAKQAAAAAAASSAPVVPAASGVSAPLGASRTMATEEAAFDPYADRDDLVVPAADASILDVVARMFDALMMADADDTWALMAKLTHSEQLVGPRALDHYKAFTWHKARRSAPNYLTDGDSKSFAIDYTEPTEVGDGVDRVKIFLKKHGGMPAPVSLERDPRNGGAWRLSGLSL